MLEEVQNKKKKKKKENKRMRKKKRNDSWKGNSGDCVYVRESEREK